MVRSRLRKRKGSGVVKELNFYCAFKGARVARPSGLDPQHLSRPFAKRPSKPVRSKQPSSHHILCTSCQLPSHLYQHIGNRLRVSSETCFLPVLPLPCSFSLQSCLSSPFSSNPIRRVVPHMVRSPRANTYRVGKTAEAPCSCGQQPHYCAYSAPLRLQVPLVACIGERRTANSTRQLHAVPMR